MKRICVLFFHLIVFFISYAQQLPYIQRFQNIPEFESTTDPIVKTIIQANDGVVYLGKRSGLYSFNGTLWEKIYSTNKEELSDVHLLEKDTDGIIWVVSKSGIGYLKKNPNGIDSVYIFRLKNDTIFRDAEPKKLVFSEKRLFVLTSNNQVLSIPFQTQNNQIQLSEPKFFDKLKFTHLFKLGKRIFFYQNDKGLLEYVNNQFNVVKSFEPFFSKTNELKAFIQFNPYRGLLCMDKNYFWFDGENLKEISLENPKLLSSGILTGIRYDNNSIVIATFYEGCLIYDIQSGNLIKQLNTKNGYNEGEIFSLMVDKERGIWIGGKNGLVRAIFKDYLQDYQNLNQIGENVNDVYAFGKNVLFATNNGLFLVENNFKGEITSIEQIPMLKDIVCHQIDTFDYEESEDLDHSLLIATNQGLFEYQIDKKKVIPILSEPVQKILPLSYDYALIVSSFEVKLIEKEEGKWKKPIHFTESSGIINSITANQEENQIWLGTDKGVIVLEVDEEFQKKKKLGSSLSRYGKNEVKKILGKPYAINKSGAFFLNYQNHKLEKDTSLSKYINDRTRFTEWMDKIIVYHKNEYLIIRKDSNELKIDTLYLLANIAPNPYQIITDNDRQIFIFTKDNVIRYNINIYKQFQKFYAKTDSTHQTIIYKLLINDIPISLTQDIPTFDVIHHLELYFGGENFNNCGVFLFQYYIEGINENWSEWKRDKKLVLNGLTYGNYTIHIRIKDDLGRVWKEATYSFNIQKPWYLTIYAIFFYIIAGIVLVYLIVKMYSANLERIIKERTIDLENQKKIAIREREFAEEQKKIAEEKNNLLIQANEELKVSIETIQNQQEQLIRQEKMATLGQLVANTAHELNTPIGAILNSIRNIENSLPDTFHQLPHLLQKLNPSEQEIFFEYSVKAILDKKNLSTQEERHLRMNLENQLYQNQIPFADEIADKLVSIGLTDNLDKLIQWIKTKSELAQEIINMIYLLGKIGTNLNVIRIAADKTKKKVHGLKVYSHSQPDEPLTEVNLVENIETVIMVYSHHFKHDIELIRNYIDQPIIKGYADALMQVWTNLIFNAIQAMGGKGKITITIQKNNHSVITKIEDNGPGIPIDIQDKIFQALFTTKSKGEGSGLGLTIVQKILEKHNGKISFESAPGKTVFIVELPL